MIPSKNCSIEEQIRQSFGPFSTPSRRLREQIPRIRPVFVGRSELEYTPTNSNSNSKKIEFEQIQLNSFVKQAANGYLTKLKVENKSLRRKIYQHFGGNPLTLQLAAALAREDGLASVKRLTAKRFGRLFHIMDEAALQRELVIRNLDHIHDPDVKDIAVPGLLVRKVNADIIQHVLAEPCGLGKISKKKSKEIQEALEKETFLIQSSRDSSGIVFRQDLRRAMEDHIVNHYKESAQMIHDKAVTYYGQQESSEGQAEYVYHRLKREDDPVFLTKALYSRVSQHLDRSLDELPLNAQVHIASFSGSDLSREKLKQAKQEDWEKYYAKIIRDALKEDVHNLELILYELSLRSIRSFNNPLYYWEARLYQRLNQLNRSNKLLKRAIREAKTDPEPESQEMRYRMMILQVENQEYQSSFEAAYKQLQAIPIDELTEFDPLLRFQMEVLNTRLAARLGSEVEADALLMAGEQMPDFEINDTYKTYQSYYELDLYDDRFPYNTLRKEAYLEQFQQFQARYDSIDSLEDFAIQNLGSELSGLAEPGRYEILLRDVFHRTNESILSQVLDQQTQAPTSNFDQLARILAEYYPSIDASKRILSVAGIYDDYFSFEQSTIRNWTEILFQLDRSNQLDALLQEVLKEYPQDPTIPQYVRTLSDDSQTSSVNPTIVQRLSGLFPDVGSSREFLKEIGIKTREIAFQASSSENWQSILQALEKSKELNHFFQSLFQKTPDQELEKVVQETSSISLYTDVSQALEEENALDVEELMRLLSDGKLEEVLNKLSQVTDPKVKEISLIAYNRFRRLVTTNRDGIISPQDYNIGINRITNILVELIKENQDLARSSVSARSPSTDEDLADIERFHKLIKDDELKQVLNEIVAIQALESETQNEALHLLGRLNKLEEENMKGLLYWQEYDVEKSKIAAGLVELVKKIEQQQLSSSQEPASRGLITSTPTLLVPKKDEFHKTIGDENLLRIEWLQKAIEIAKIVCKLDTPEGAIGNGILLQGGYLLTVAHVFADQPDVISKTRIIFDAPEKETVSFELAPAEEVIINQVMDYALVKIQDYPDDPLKKFGHAKMPSLTSSSNDRENDLQLKTLISSIQFPAGNQKRIATADKIISTHKDAFFYLGDAHPGVSGSPVFNRNWEVIGIHQASGTMRINDAGDEQYANRAIKMRAILKDLSDRGINL